MLPAEVAMVRLECLDGLRGLLATYVLVSHMAAFTILPAWLTAPFAHGGAAVDVFFILSGMVILRSLEGTGFDRSRFLVACATRVMPAFLVVFALAVAVQPLPTALAWMPWVAPDDPGRAVWSTGWPDRWAVEIGAHVAMLHGLFPEGVLPGAWISFLGAAWSLSTEAQFYAVVALAAPALRRRHGMERVFLGVAAALAWEWLAPDDWQFSRAFLPNKAQYFALGMASAAWSRTRAPGPGGVSRWCCAPRWRCAPRGAGRKAWGAAGVDRVPARAARAWGGAGGLGTGLARGPAPRRADAGRVILLHLSGIRQQPPLRIHHRNAIYLSNEDDGRGWQQVRASRIRLVATLIVVLISVGVSPHDVSASFKLSRWDINLVGFERRSGLALSFDAPEKIKYDTRLVPVSIYWRYVLNNGEQVYHKGFVSEARFRSANTCSNLQGFCGLVWEYEPARVSAFIYREARNAFPTFSGKSPHLALDIVAAVAGEYSQLRQNKEGWRISDIFYVVANCEVQAAGKCQIFCATL